MSVPRWATLRRGTIDGVLGTSRDSHNGSRAAGHRGYYDSVLVPVLGRARSSSHSRASASGSPLRATVPASGWAHVAAEPSHQQLGAGPHEAVDREHHARREEGTQRAIDGVSRAAEDDAGATGMRIARTGQRNPSLEQEAALAGDRDRAY